MAHVEVSKRGAITKFRENSSVFNSGPQSLRHSYRQKAHRAPHRNMRSCAACDRVLLSRGLRSWIMASMLFRENRGVEQVLCRVRSSYSRCMCQFQKIVTLGHVGKYISFLSFHRYTDGQPRRLIFSRDLSPPTPLSRSSDV